MPYALRTLYRAPFVLGTYNGVTWTSGTIPIGLVDAGGSIIFGRIMRSATTWDNLPHNPGAGSYFWIGGSYITT